MQVELTNTDRMPGYVVYDPGSQSVLGSRGYDIEYTQDPSIFGRWLDGHLETFGRLNSK